MAMHWRRGVPQRCSLLHFHVTAFRFSPLWPPCYCLGTALDEQQHAAGGGLAGWNPAGAEPVLMSLCPFKGRGQRHGVVVASCEAHIATRACAVITVHV
jgi:hypothetical protein